MKFITLMRTMTLTTPKHQQYHFRPLKQFQRSNHLQSTQKQHTKAALSSQRLYSATTSSRSNENTNSNTSIRPWPKPLVESKGDYRQEAFLEQHIGGPLYEKQTSLPRLPIPTIQETINTFLPTAIPLAENKDEIKTLKEACDIFPIQARKFHDRLHERKDGEMSDSSWLQHWWNTAGYLQVRDTVVVNVSYFFHFSDDGTLPVKNYLEGPTTSMAQSSAIQRGASILTAVAQFRKLVCSGSLPCEKIGKKKVPLCSTAFKYMFNACRIPYRVQDTYRMYDPSLHDHCVVAYKGRFFSIDFMDENGKALALHTLEDRLRQCVEEVDDNRQEGSSSGLDLGWLTSSDRDSWADSRAELLRVGGKPLEQALEKLESGAIILCLDDEAPVSRKQCADIFWTGGLSSGKNRWFDKSIQIMVTKNGKAGLIGEHSMMDGMPMIALANHITNTSYESVASKEETDRALFSVAEGSVQDIFVACTKALSDNKSKIPQMIEKAKQDFITLVNDHSLNVQSFRGYGSSYIKKAGYSPDAYVQMAIQLAVYRLFEKQAGTYEATQMRPYLHGRTETTRSVSPESEAFVKCMGLTPKRDENDPEARKVKINLLGEAVKAHVKYIVAAGKGKGVDRHFLGMSMLVADNEEAPDLYSHPLFIRSKTWRVSTSHLTHPKFENWGFGEVVPDGVGVGYGVKSDCCIFNITARKEHDWTERLCHLLEEALLEMQLLNELDKSLSSKL